MNSLVLPKRKFIEEVRKITLRKGSSSLRVCNNHRNSYLYSYVDLGANQDDFYFSQRDQKISEKPKYSVDQPELVLQKEEEELSSQHMRADYIKN